MYKSCRYSAAIRQSQSFKILQNIGDSRSNSIAMMLWAVAPYITPAKTYPASELIQSWLKWHGYVPVVWPAQAEKKGIDPVSKKFISKGFWKDLWDPSWKNVLGLIGQDFHSSLQNFLVSLLRAIEYVSSIFIEFNLKKWYIGFIQCCNLQ